jgi:hypothetical protein
MVDHVDTVEETSSSTPPEIENPKALLNAYERTKEEKKKIALEKAELEARYKDIDVDKYQALLEQEKAIAEAKTKAEEEKLVQERNWEALVAKKTSQIEEQYKLKLEKTNADYNEVEKKYQTTEEQLAIAKKEVEEMSRKFEAYNSFIKNKGKPESFKYLWEGELKQRTRIGESGQLELLKAPGSEDVLFDEQGEIVDVSAWMQTFRSNGGAAFFNPITEAAGSGANPSTAGSVPTFSAKAITISRQDLGNANTMKAIASQLQDGNINKAIMDGRVVVK